jgi:C1A family cysteine protease
MTQEEFAAQYLTLKVNRKYENEHPMLGMTQEGLKANIDWVADGKVTPVKNQGQCGSCWAFSAIAAVESAVLLAGRPQQLFSEQQLVDCSRGYGNAGCNGGWMDSAFKYIIDNGITTSAAYPYAARDQTCAIQGGSFKIKGFIDTPSCTSLTNALSGRPISVAVDASNWSPYRSGVFSNCGTSVNHGVLLVGATDSTWVIKNSWGGSWGDNGFIRLSQGNTCAVCGYPSYPTI